MNIEPMPTEGETTKGEGELGEPLLKFIANKKLRKK